MDQYAERILELRIHGMNNTPPHELLEVAQGDVELSQGDSLGGFWTPTAEASSRARRHAEADPDRLVPDDIPDDVRREAYSWGSMARTSPGPTAAGPKAWLAVVIRAGWLMLIPFGLANGAYWTRRLRKSSNDRTEYGPGAGQVRLFGYLLTLFGVCALVTVSCWELATWRLAFSSDCLDAPEGTCRELPQWVDPIVALGWPQRLAIGSLVPVLVLVGLWWLSRASKLRYETPTSGAIPDPYRPATGTAPSPLADPRMWTRWRLTEVSARAHLAGGIGLVTMFAATSAGWSAAEPCQTAPEVLGHLSECVLSPGSTFRMWQLVLTAVALIVVVASGATISWLSADRAIRHRRRARMSGALLAVSVVAMTVELWQLWISPDIVERTSLPGLNFTLAVLLIAMWLIAMSGLTWRAPDGWRIWLVRGLQLIVPGLLFWLLAQPASAVARWTLIGASAAFVVVCLAFVGQRHQEAWMGRGPGVWMLLALGAAVAGSSVLVVAVGDWINGGASVTSLSAVAEKGSAGQPVGLVVPNMYVESAVGSAVAFALVVLMILGYAGVLFSKGRLRSPKPDEGVQPFSIRAAQRQARLVASVSQRATWVVGVVAVAVGVALTMVAVLTVDDSIHTLNDSTPTLVEHTWFGEVAAIGLWTNAVVWSALLVRILVAQGSPGRPVELVWDLLCFLPRAGHPLAPPCYAERAIPELAARVQAWIDGEDQSRAEKRGVVLAAHSLGAVLAVATLMAMKDETRSRVALLTFGSQLRPYFGRILPELLGPGVVGNDPCEPHNWQGLSIWSEEEGRLEAPAPGPQDPRSLVVLLYDRNELARWVNLWRATDPLGMPAMGHGENAIDRAAAELDETSYLPAVATHSNYPRTAEYRDAVTGLVRQLDGRPRRGPAEIGAPDLDPLPRLRPFTARLIDALVEVLTARRAGSAPPQDGPVVVTVVERLTAASP